MKLTEYDERHGLVKTDWAEVRCRIAKVEPQFAEIVDQLSPGKNFALYLAYYPYGAVEGDTQSSFLPDLKGGYYRLSDPDIPSDLRKHLGYGKDSSPLGMVLDKELELFIDLPDEKVTIPWLIYQPGKIFPFSRILSRQSQRVYAPNGLLSSTAGVRSAFMLPSIGCSVNHHHLQRDYNIKSPPPKSLHEHWAVFKEIAQSEVSQCEWRCCIMYFAENWIDKIHNDQAWVPLKQYLHELAWLQNEYERNRVFYDMAFSMIQKKRNLKPNPYLADTAKHLFTTAIGAAPGYQPALNDNALPLKTLQQAFIQSYGLKKYYPTVMQPTHFNFETDRQSIYYSLQHPSTQVFSPRSRQASSTLFEIRELEHICQVFSNELSKNESLCSDTVIAQAAKKLAFEYFHNKHDQHGIVRLSAELADIDHRFSIDPYQLTDPVATFAADAPFIRGCVRIYPECEVEYKAS